MQALFTSVALTLTLCLPATQSADVFCGTPPAIQFASIEDISDESSDEEYSLGATVTYACQYGYTAKGKSRILKCDETDTEDGAEWTQPLFSCTPQSCGDPGHINNGRRSGSLFTFPNAVKYECDEGYKLRGLSARYCQPSGSWSGRLPFCEEVRCKPPQDPDNGYVTYSSLEYGSELLYVCDKGYHLDTTETVSCTSDGSWSITDVHCVESSCDIPLEPEYGSMHLGGSSNTPREGSMAFFSCNGDRIPDGPTTSKCLDTGQWTFPPPKCLEPCSIPYVTDGVIGKYVREGYRRIKVFKVVSVGDKVEEDLGFFLRCSDKYEVLGSEKNEEEVVCSRGKWSQELECKPASCRSQPPSVENGQAVALSPEHGGKVLYLCNTDFKKTQNESVICDFGNWKGSVPICKSTRCLVDELTFPGLVKGRKSYYRDGEVFQIECESRYRVSNERIRQLKCDEGTWKGPLPPCVAASCKKSPPQIDLGRAEISSSAHSSIVKYVCEDPYIPVGSSQVQCSFGEWEGQPPKCQDSRCYLKNLQLTAYIDIPFTSSVTSSGNRLQPVCKDGYSPKSERPLCLEGKWTQNSASPCRESDCSIPLLYNGDIKEEKIGDYYWNWRKFRYDREVHYIKIPAGTIMPFGSSLILICDTGYSFQGTQFGRRGITCTKGRWTPDPVCLIVGAKYVPPTTTTRAIPRVTPSLPAATQKPKVIETRTTPMSRTSSTKIELLETEAPIVTTEPPEEECYCEYPINDENLVAHADGKRLNFEDKVNDGSVVVFRCEHVGFHYLSGPQEIKCENCHNWRSSELPTCIEPSSGSAVIIFDKTINVSMGGDLEASRGQNVELMCVAIESSVYPHWSFPTDSGVTVTRERRERESYGDVLYVSHLQIQNTEMENEGPYGCAVGKNPMNIVRLLINDPNLRCPELPEDDNEMSITYDMERQVKSQASFSCKKHNQKLVGDGVLTCLRNGKWSGPSPQCEDIKCKELKGNDLLSIYYNRDREIGSMASFHCFAPGQRLGASFATCLENGTWSNPTPTCKSPPCPLEDLFSAVPENVVPDMENTNVTFLYNSTVKLTCADDLIVEGYPVAKCGRKGEWEFREVICKSGCPPLINSSPNLIVKPEKDEYKFGDMIALSCPPGMNLDIPSQLIMCLKHGWSETVLPKCE